MLSPKVPSKSKSTAVHSVCSVASIVAAHLLSGDYPPPSPGNHQLPSENPTPIFADLFLAIVTAGPQREDRTGARRAQRAALTLRQEGRFAPAIKVGRRMLWDEEVLTAWLEANREAQAR